MVAIKQAFLGNLENRYEDDPQALVNKRFLVLVTRLVILRVCHWL
jgi:hypothetical protein